MKVYNNYPLWIVFITNLFALLVYFSGSFIIFRLSVFTGILFVVYIIILEFSIYKKSCPNCFYFGKFCAFGRGKIAKLFFKKGDLREFCSKKYTWKNFIPNMLVVLIPVVVGIALLISRGIDIFVLAFVIFLLFSWFFLNPIIFGKLSCPHCKQGKKCCPALEFFSKAKN